MAEVCVCGTGLGRHVGKSKATSEVCIMHGPTRHVAISFRVYSTGAFFPLCSTHKHIIRLFLHTCTGSPLCSITFTASNECKAQK